MKKSSEIFNLPVKSGEYYFQMNTHAGCNNKPFEFEYLKVSGNVEEEINNKTSTAKLLTENIETTGYLQEKQSYEKDVDYYRISLLEKGILQLNLKHENFDNKEYFFLELFNDENEQLLKANSFLNKKGISQYIGLDKGEYFAKVSTYSASTKVRGKEYQISYIFNKLVNAEVENNEITKNATLINDNVSITGYYQDKGKGVGTRNADKDFYAYNAQKGSYSLIFEHEEYENRDSLTVQILDEEMKQIYLFNPKASSIKNKFNLELDSKKYYIVLQNIYHSSGQEYKIKIIKN